MSRRRAQVRGVINGRSGTTITLQTDSGNVVVVLTDATQVQEGEVYSMHAGKEMALAALVPGLAVEVQGNCCGGSRSPDL